MKAMTRSAAAAERPGVTQRPPGSPSGGQLERVEELRGVASLGTRTPGPRVDRQLIAEEGPVVGEQDARDGAVCPAWAAR